MVGKGQKQAVKVFGRIRPEEDVDEDGAACGPTVRVQPCGTRIHFQNKETRVEIDFPCDLAFGQTTAQEDIFGEVGPDVVKAVMEGKSACVLAYGQTGSGKTHTMIGSDADPGLAPRIIDAVLEYTVGEGGDGESGRVSVHGSALEIYNEAIRDLLVPPKPTKKGPAAEPAKLKLREGGGCFYCPEAVSRRLARGQGALFLKQALGQRVVSKTSMNDQSSRSHLVLVLDVVQELRIGGRLVSRLYLADLAGSEDISRSKAVGQQVSEACGINSSLLELRRVMEALAAKSKHINYRNSILTKLLKPALGGDAATYLVCNLSPIAANVVDTKNTLKFAQISTKVVNCVVNKHTKTFEELEAEVAATKNTLQQIQGHIDAMRGVLEGAAGGSETAAMPPEFVCPLGAAKRGTLVGTSAAAAKDGPCAMENPVIAADGKTYEFANLRQQFRYLQRQPDPLSCVALPNANTLFWFPNKLLKRQIVMNDQHRVPPTQTLPQDVLMLVFSYLDGVVVNECAMVCWSWQAGARDEGLWELLLLRDHSEGGKDGGAGTPAAAEGHPMQVYFKKVPSTLTRPKREKTYGIGFVAKKKSAAKTSAKKKKQKA
eukprot:TRINITY_DN30002_c0_g1_i1.p1 TRINITY_DN30002_c0_g1~~TRINITY_DN30002_c0_g1_i1.p1  ORF type:complete len:601 (+),score=229.80 TRINITY_DN30002_c0_g1_i1:54-1856(+)